MRIVDLDYYAMYGNSWLHKVPTRFKLFTAVLILLMVVNISNYAILGLVYLTLLLIILFSSVPKIKIIMLSFYPLLFLVVYAFSITNLTPADLLLLIFKVLTAATTFVLLIFTTTYVEIFKRLSKILPAPLVSALFLTYRSIFILWKIFENLQLAIHIRGGLKFTRPIYSMRIIGKSLGYLIIKAIEVSEDMYECMRIRGYSNSLRYLRK